MSKIEVLDMAGVPVREMMDYGGYIITTFGMPAEQVARSVKNIPSLPIRSDDVFLSTPVKSGTHWANEIISMVVSGKIENTNFPKLAAMIEAATPEDIDKFPSPRVINSHMQFDRLPKQVQEGKCKIVLIVRNPKDVFWSMYQHHRHMMFYDYKGEWENYLPLMMEGKLEYGSWFDLIKDWEKRLKDHPDRILLVHYEDLKQNGLKEAKRISEFLGKSRDDKFLQAVVDKCSFQNMKKDKQYPKEIMETVFGPNFDIFRKGEVGDWQNHFTVAQNKRFDKIYAERMKGCNIKFRFTLDEEEE